MKYTFNSVLLWSDSIQEPYWNFAARLKGSRAELPKTLQSVINFYKKLGRKPAVYVTPWSDAYSNKAALEAAGFKAAFKDSWMFFSGRITDFKLNKDIDIVQVKTKEEMETFARVLSEAYGTDAYTQALVQSFDNKPKGCIVLHFLAKTNDEYAGCASVLHDNRYALLANGGVISKFRKQGVGATLMAASLAVAHQEGNQILFLRAEQDSENEKLFERFGFKTRFTGEGFVAE